MRFLSWVAKFAGNNSHQHCLHTSGLALEAFFCYALLQYEYRAYRHGGSRKSYIGKRLAEKSGLDFVDSDDMLEHKFGKSIQELLEEVGEQEYLELEARTLIMGTGRSRQHDTGSGGSIIYRPDAMDHLKDISTILYLKVPYETIQERKKGCFPRAVIGLEARPSASSTTSATRSILSCRPCHDTARLDTDGVSKPYSSCFVDKTLPPE